ncbi:right-handed parallel beta-helix repeat-containing protein [Paenibacillus montanisoli]|uniref:Fibronectin type-III domain-containing protein n=1 Tax=Paenibacillus montanisoli TaxID=2081970 RepID=A0A328U0V3_9BACL|nr:right-handed parallel beta-helix repeat-containing protein [Paenibacillus montanisoli]RAP75682.1 hypothetical protein DL346_09495 [Paenibacillus montanisoli]
MNDTYFNVVENNRFEGPYIRHGALIQYYAHNNLILNNVFDGTVYDSIDLHGEDEYLNEITGNAIYNTSMGGGIGVGNTGGTAPTNHDASGPKNYIHHNTISGAREGIIIYMGSPDTVIEHNVIENTGREDAIGIIVRNAPGTVLKDNIIRNNTGLNFWSIALQHDNGDVNAGEAGKGDPSNVLIADNTIAGNMNGIRIEAGTGIVLRNNGLNNLGTELYLAPGAGVDTTEQPLKPDVVGGLQAQVGDERIDLTWSPSEGALSYTVLRLEDQEGHYETIASGIEAPAYTDTHVSIGNKYFYRIIAVNDIGESTPSEAAGVTLVNLFTVSAPVLRDASGAIARELDPKSAMTVEITAVNRSETGKSLSLVAALYDKMDRLEEIKIIEKEIAGGTTEVVTAELYIPNGLGHGYRLQVYGYNSMSELVPLTEPVIWE